MLEQGLKTSKGHEDILSDDMGWSMLTVKKNDCTGNCFTKLLSACHVL